MVASVGPNYDAMLSPEDVGRILAISTTGARRLMAAGRIPSVNVGAGTRNKVWRCTLEALQAFIAAATEAPAPPPPPSTPRLPPHVQAIE